MSSPLENVRLVVSDLDGVVYRGADAIPGAVKALSALGESPVVYATNNASRPPEDVARHLQGLGLAARTADVVTSAMAGAQVLLAALEAEGRHGSVLAVGGPGVRLALEARGVTVVGTTDDDDPPVGVLQGYGPDTRWSAFGEASYAIARGARWCLTNGDLTIPTARGTAPGNGMGGVAVRAATGVEPLVAGKPETPIYDLAMAVHGVPAEEALALGDRLDTDILGAGRAGMRSVLVLTGVHDVPDVAAATGESRPTYLLPDLATLREDYVEAAIAGTDAVCGEAQATRADERLVATGGSAIERARALVALAWSLVDAGEIAADDVARLVPRWRELVEERG